MRSVLWFSAVTASVRFSIHTTKLLSADSEWKYNYEILICRSEYLDISYEKVNEIGWCFCLHFACWQFFKTSYWIRVVIFVMNYYSSEVIFFITHSIMESVWNKVREPLRPLRYHDLRQLIFIWECFIWRSLNNYEGTLLNRKHWTYLAWMIS